MMDDDGRRTDDGPWLYYKLTNGLKGSGELKGGYFLNQFNMTVNMIDISSPINCLDSDNFIASDAMLRKQSFDKAYNSKYLHSIRGSITITSLSQPLTSRARARERG